MSGAAGGRDFQGEMDALVRESARGGALPPAKLPPARTEDAAGGPDESVVKGVAKAVALDAALAGARTAAVVGALVLWFALGAVGLTGTFWLPLLLATAAYGIHRWKGQMRDLGGAVVAGTAGVLALVGGFIPGFGMVAWLVAMGGFVAGALLLATWIFEMIFDVGK